MATPRPRRTATESEAAARGAPASPARPPRGEPEPTSDAALGAPEVSVVVPVFWNADTLVELLDRLDASLAGEDREYVLVVDGSPDDSLRVLRAELERRPRLRIVELARNFGQHAALCAGFDAVRGRVALLLDADLQQRPEDLPRFLERWRAGHDFVSGWRRTRRDPLPRRLGSVWMNQLVRLVTGVRLHDWGCPLAAVDRSILERIPSCGEQRRFLKPLVAGLARNVAEVEIEGFERSGRSSYSMLGLLGLTLDFAISFSHRPFQRLTGLGLLTFLGAILVGGAYVAARLVGAVGDSARLQAVVVLGTLLGLQLVILGTLGEFTHRVYRIVQGQPLYEVRRRYDADTPEGAPAREEAR